LSTSSDGTLYDFYRKPIIFSYKRFTDSIIEGDSCFLCGAEEGSKEFNDEHVFPEWLLRKYNLFHRSLTLPNGETTTYDKYKIPCCVDCNTFLGKRLEQPVSQIVSKVLLGYDGGRSIQSILTYDEMSLFYVWLNLLYFKNYLKDTKLRYFLDHRKPKDSIFSKYESIMHDLHHVHCVARSIYTGVEIQPDAFGSLLYLKTEMDSFADPFDYADDMFMTFTIQFNSFSLVCVLNDAGATNSVFTQWLKDNNLTFNKLGIIQVREICARYSYFNILRKNRPRFFTTISKSDPMKPHLIRVERPPKIKLAKYVPKHFGMLMRMWLRTFDPILVAVHGKGIVKNINEGTTSFLLKSGDAEGFNPVNLSK